ncbi:hypothetical protein L6270_01265 [Candidatus Parcubacteria bacterium]|nr:hypothetical protein [Patescibacteria group bacterium]MBU4309769.1 hypothetical protein [Patescibacteria group bacterium]MBU4431775.1 hypothetical protein [Patescibacteria group bacterium]MBU4578108.1 hypothetical protein [Patescibacteria group bacterium]MCG2696645.1 hypothetical protein [Candidatus Parcubacteria bacterium]
MDIDLLKKLIAIIKDGNFLRADNITVVNCLKLRSLCHVLASEMQIDIHMEKSIGAIDYYKICDNKIVTEHKDNLKEAKKTVNDLMTVARMYIKELS